ncbi:hypothetical protein [Lysinibacillus sp. 54212]|uniref:hypothetical protein n=1 Tax=Lysinibacillus sp. 54212 TaxID=3119829 RepID=UPI002FC75A52
MNQFMLNFGFLYFPEDKSTYIPAFIELAIIMLLCLFVYKWLRKVAAKQAVEAKKLEERALQERNERMKKDNLS